MAEYKSALTENNTDLQEILNAIDELPEYVDTTDATAAAGDMRSGKTAYVNGEKVTGNVPVKSSSDLTVSGAKVNVPAGIYDSAASKSVATATQATPSISVDSAGKITALAEQEAGYVAAGTKSATKQLTTKAAATITPKTTDQTIAKDTYLTGVQTIKGDANLIAANILKGKSIFGVSGSAVSGATIKTGTITPSYGNTLTIPIDYVPTLLFVYATTSQSSYSVPAYICIKGTSATECRANLNSSYPLNIYSHTVSATVSDGALTYSTLSYPFYYNVSYVWYAIS